MYRLECASVSDVVGDAVVVFVKFCKEIILDNFIHVSYTGPAPTP